MKDHRNWWMRASWLCLFSVILLTGCSEASEPLAQSQIANAITSTVPEVTVIINGGSYAPNISERISIEWKDNMTLNQALAHTGTVKLKDDSSGIASVGDVSLDPQMTWGLLLNEQEIRARDELTEVIEPNDQITVYVKELDVDTSSAVIPNITLSIDGGSALPEVTASYALPLEQEVKLLDVLEEFGNIVLSDDKRVIEEIDRISLLDKYDVQLLLNDRPLSMDVLAVTLGKADDHMKLVVTKKSN